jgi:hypothetical protein
VGSRSKGGYKDPLNCVAGRQLGKLNSAIKPPRVAVRIRRRRRRMSRRRCYVLDGRYGRRYIRAWMQRSKLCIQIWNRPIPSGRPAGEYLISPIHGVGVAISSALAQTPIGKLE